MTRLFALLTLGLLVTGCHFTSYSEETSFSDTWLNHAPHARLEVETLPTGARVEVFNDNDEWVTVGSTPGMRPMLLEATGKPYLIRVSKQGYYSEVVRVALQGADSEVRVELRKDEFADPADYMHEEYRKDRRN